MNWLLPCALSVVTWTTFLGFLNVFQENIGPMRWQAISPRKGYGSHLYLLGWHSLLGRFTLGRFKPLIISIRKGWIFKMNAILANMEGECGWLAYHFPFSKRLWEFLLPYCASRSWFRGRVTLSYSEDPCVVHSVSLVELVVEPVDGSLIDLLAMHVGSWQENFSF